MSESGARVGAGGKAHLYDMARDATPSISGMAFPFQNSDHVNCAPTPGIVVHASVLKSARTHAGDVYVALPLV